MSTGSQEAARTSGGQGEFGPGALIGGSYRLINFIGAGAMGDVYKAKHEMMPREYALKILNENQVTENAWRRFQLEAQAIAKLNHKSIVSIHNFGIHNGSKPFYVMELLEGESLFDRLNRCEFLKEAEALPIFIELCDAFGYAHKQGIIHRDIKPQNIILLHKPELGSAIRIVDFGIAKLAQTADPQNQNLTRMGEVFGSPFYMSPEQTMGQRVDSRSDIYSLGCTLYETLVSMPPLRGRNSTETMILHQTKIPPALKEASDAQTFSDGIEYVVAKMLAKAPSDRYQTMEAVKHDLELLQQGKDLNTVSYYAAPSPRRSTQRIEAQVEERGNLREELSESSQYTVPPSGNKLLPVFIITGIVLTFAAVGFIGYNYLISSQTKTTPKLPQINISEYGEAMPAAPNPLNDESKLVISKSDPSSYLKKPFPFAKTVDSGGKRLRAFSFPKDLDFGYLKTKENMDRTRGSAGQTAESNPRFEFTDHVILTPSKALIANPEFLTGFRSGDIYAVAFSTDFQIKNGLSHFSKIPGLSALILVRYADEGAESVKTLRDFSSIRELWISESRLNLSTLSSSDLPQSLELLAISNPAKDFILFPTKILPGKNLKQLNFVGLDFTRQDFKNFGQIKTLEDLEISNSRAIMTGAEIRELANLKQLKRLTLSRSQLTSDAEKELAKFKQLKSLTVRSKQITAELYASARKAGFSIIKEDEPEPEPVQLPAMNF
ncbi:MAG: protein kinase [Candidatus Obscuribacterales bacterium]|nr:protein kinase [Candidatus Obscuribacterales bacterium]